MKIIKLTTLEFDMQAPSSTDMPDGQISVKIMCEDGISRSWSIAVIASFMQVVENNYTSTGAAFDQLHAPR